LSVAKIDKKLSILKITVNSENELFSKAFTEALVSMVSNFYVETKIKKSVENVAILQHQTDSIRNQLNLAISGVAQSNDAIPNLNSARQVLRSSGQQRQIDVQANTAILTELVKNLELSKLSLRKETPLIQVIDRPVLPLPLERFGKAKGILLGGLLSGFLLVIFLMDLKEVFKGNELCKKATHENIDIKIPLIGYAIGIPPIDSGLGEDYLINVHIKENEKNSLEEDDISDEINILEDE
jgi:hypothetical protein